MENREYSGAAVPGYRQHSQDLVLSEALTSSLIFLLYFPEYLPAPKMFRIQYF